MLIIKIIGGLGNQMFQYAYAKSLASRGCDIKIDKSVFDTYIIHSGFSLDKYKIDLPLATRNEIDIFGSELLREKIKKKLYIKNKNILREKTLLFDTKMLTPHDNSYIEGYFQTEKYFLEIRETLLNQFTLNKTLSNYSQEIEHAIENANISVSLHIRRGDYLSNPKAMKMHGFCDLDYYIKAINLLENKYDNISYFIFSDDIEWVRENLKIENSIFVTSAENRLPHEDIYLMSLCHHNIIANSSFSWWSAWLNKNINKIVIAPKRWFANEKMQKQSKDLIPESWMKL